MTPTVMEFKTMVPTQRLQQKMALRTDWSSLMPTTTSSPTRTKFKRSPTPTETIRFKICCPIPIQFVSRQRQVLKQKHCATCRSISVKTQPLTSPQFNRRSAKSKVNCEPMMDRSLDSGPSLLIWTTMAFETTTKPSPCLIALVTSPSQVFQQETSPCEPTSLRVGCQPKVLMA